MATALLGLPWRSLRSFVLVRDAAVTKGTLAATGERLRLLLITEAEASGCSVAGVWFTNH
jgi:hypothetical protein